MKPGIYANLTFSEYQQIDALNASTIVAASRTMDSTLVEKEDTPAMRLGRAFHSYILQPDVWARDWILIPADCQVGSGKGQRDRLQTFMDSIKTGQEIFSDTDCETVEAIKTSLYSGKYETARQALEGAQQREITLVWKNKKHGCLMKARLDAIWDNIIIDIKTSTTADHERWMNIGLRAGGKPHFQVAHYRQAVQALIDPGCKTFIWILFENKAPWGISVVKATPPDEGETDMAYLAEQEMDPIIDRYLAAKRSGVFTGRPDRVQSISIPQYYIKNAL